MKCGVQASEFYHLCIGSAFSVSHVNLVWAGHSGAARWLKGGHVSSRTKPDACRSRGYTTYMNRGLQVRRYRQRLKFNESSSYRQLPPCLVSHNMRESLSGSRLDVRLKRQWLAGIPSEHTQLINIHPQDTHEIPPSVDFPSGTIGFPSLSKHFEMSKVARV